MHYKLIISERAELHIDNILDYVVNTLNNPGAAKAILSDIEEAFKTRFAYVLSSEFPNDPQIYTRTCLQGVLHLTGLKCILP
jgi:hypothetical protein